MEPITIQNCKMELLYLKNEKKHVHQDIELIYLIEREAEINSGESSVLKARDIAVINSNVQHSIRTGSRTTAFRLMIPYRLLGMMTSEEMVFFQCNSALYVSNNYQEMRRLTEMLLLKYLNVDKRDMSEIASIIFQIIHELFGSFRVDANRIALYVKEFKNSKIDRILNYINFHYFEPLNLIDVASYFGVSETYLSRYFKKQTGKNFVNYLNDIRTDNAAFELLSTDKSITNIAVDNGFSTPSVLNRYFRKKYGITPTAYRRQSENMADNDVIEGEKAEQVKQQISRKMEQDMMKSADSKKVLIRNICDCAQWTDKSRLINIGDAGMIGDAQIQKHILFIRDALGISCVRIWNLFSEKFMIAEDFTGDSFNFDYLDRIFDFFIQNKIFLFIDLGKRSRVIMAASKNELYSDMQQYTLNNIAEWENLLEHFVVHLTRRYDRRILEQWIFEFPWSKEEYYTEGYQYTSAYEAGRAIIKKYLLNCRIAGISPNPGISEQQIREAIHILSEKKIFPEILTMKIFPDTNIQMMEEMIHQTGNDYLYARQYIEKIIGMTKEEGCDCKICISEWSNQMSNRNMIQDSCARGTYVLRFVQSIWKLVDMMGFWHGTDAVDLFYDSKKLIYGGGGLLTKDGIKKPVFYAFEFMSKLGSDMLKMGNNYIVTRNSAGTIVCLCFNYREYSSYYYLKKDSIAETDLNKAFLDEEKEQIEFTIDGLEHDGIYLLKEEVVNNKNGSIQDEWRLLENQEELGSEEIQYLKNICIPKLFMEHVVCVDGKISFDVTIEPHEIRMIYINKY